MLRSDDFDVDVMTNISVVRVHTREDLFEMRSDVQNAKTKVVLWCDGIL